MAEQKYAELKRLAWALIGARCTDENCAAALHRAGCESDNAYARYIVAANPATILALLSDLAAAEQRAARAETREGRLRAKLIVWDTVISGNEYAVCRGCGLVVEWNGRPRPHGPECWVEAALAARDAAPSAGHGRDRHDPSGAAFFTAECVRCGDIRACHLRGQCEGADCECQAFVEPDRDAAPSDPLRAHLVGCLTCLGRGLCRDARGMAGIEDAAPNHTAMDGEP